MLGLNGCPHCLHTLTCEFNDAPHTPQNFIPSLITLLHLGQLFEAGAEKVPQNAQNFAPGTSILLHFEHIFDCFGVIGFPIAWQKFHLV